MAGNNVMPFNTLRLEYVLKEQGVTRQSLMEAQDWSSSTYYRKMNAENDWTVSEITTLIALGVDITDIIDIFF